MAKWTRNHMLELGAVTLALGVILTFISFAYAFLSADKRPWLDWYANLVQRPEGNYNLILFILGPILLLTGGFYLGEQVVLRRRFERLLDTPKRSEFSSRRRDLEELARRLPEPYMGRIEAKENEFKSKRSA